MKDKRTFDQLNDNIMVIKIIFKISIGLKHNVRLNTLIRIGTLWPKLTNL